ncbi:MAG TPA: hypothetical protein PKK95_03345 [Vicinamibacterales bacterium]|nr:hypothetical protein [Acidobacteriota bacterium]HOC17274.1 hypothetical protein [Vicinamibacterales bacterium]
MNAGLRLRVAILSAGVLAVATGASAQGTPAWGRVSFFSSAVSTTPDAGSSSSFTELIGTFTVESRNAENAAFEYRADLRMAGYPGSGGRVRRVSVYDAYVGARLMEGRIGIRAGQMWLNDLGGLGSVGGGLVELRQKARTGRGRWRAGVFGGLEPKILEAGYERDVTKAGGLVAFDGTGARRHVLGYVYLRDRGRTERSVLVATNFLPVGPKLFVYQAAQYEMGGPGVSGSGTLGYLFGTARYTASSFLELQGSYHRGRSIDARTLLRDQLDGRPVLPRALEGLRFESASGRLTVTLARGIRVYGGYGRDRNNRQDRSTDRITYGFFVSDLAGTGIDLSASDSRMEGGNGRSFNSWYVSVGRSLGSSIYLTGDYASSLSVLRFVSADGFAIETRPRTRRASLSSTIRLPRRMSLVATLERVLDDDATQTRLLSGISYRF